MAERGVLYSSREIDGLIEQYHSMAQRLEELYGSLESQVAERTEQLSSANAELECQRRRVEEINAQLARTTNTSPISLPLSATSCARR